MARGDPRTAIAHYPWGFWFDDVTGEIIDAFDVWQTVVSGITKYHRYVDGERHVVVRVDPWEL